MIIVDSNGAHETIASQDNLSMADFIKQERTGALNTRKQSIEEGFITQQKGIIDVKAASQLEKETMINS